MLHHDILEAGLTRFELDRVRLWFLPCRPRILVVTDSSLNFRPDSGFGLWRFLHGITTAAGVFNKPVLTLAHRGAHVPTVTVGTDTYNVDDAFNFSTANPAVTIANYDQIWMFGFGGAALTNAEIAVIAEFMNSGGGVFATGDHGTIGRQMCGALPRIRHMREWSSIPMGTEDNVTVAVQRIDTVVNPGANNLYEFQDQSDDIPQRIYPNYKVTEATPATQWQATLHPLLALPGAPATRTEAAGNAGFTNDIDVLPDHPHESICKEVTDIGVLSANYLDAGLNFEEFRPAAANPAQRVGGEIVAYAVSGGRSVFNSVWKPPVTPRMFGVISAYDGRLAQPYPGKAQRPGRIVCDSTWHHYVNVNLDGMSTARNGLGTWSGGVPGAGTFTPSAALEKIYAYYRNTIAWLQPANRVWCRLWRDLVAVRFNAAVFEELLEVERFKGWRDFVGLGRDAAALIDDTRGRRALDDMVTGALLSDDDTERFADLIVGPALAQTTVDTAELQFGIVGGMLARLAQMLPPDNEKAAAQVLEAGPEKSVPELMAAAKRMLAMGLAEHKQRAERTLAFMSEHTPKPPGTMRPAKRAGVTA